MSPTTKWWAPLEAVLLVVDSPVTEDAAGHGLGHGLTGWSGTADGHVQRLYPGRVRHRICGKSAVVGGSTPETGSLRWSSGSCWTASRRGCRKAALETLAVIAYRQPVTRARIAGVRGVNVDGVIRTLVARGLIEEVGQDAETGGLLYRTTELFLERLGS